MKLLFLLLASFSVIFISVNCDNEIVYSGSDKDVDVYSQKLAKKVTVCDGASYVSPKSGKYNVEFGEDVFEIKLANPTVVKTSFEISPVDKELNRIEWKGAIRLNVKVFRRYTFETQSWSDWREVPKNDAFRFGLTYLTKKNGSWEVEESGFPEAKLDNISCKNIPFLNSTYFNQMNADAKNEAEKYFSKIFSKCGEYYYGTKGYGGYKMWRTKEILPVVIPYLVTDNESNEGMEWKGIVRLSQVEYRDKINEGGGWKLEPNWSRSSVYLKKIKASWIVDSNLSSTFDNKPECGQTTQ